LKGVHTLELLEWLLPGGLGTFKLYDVRVTGFDGSTMECDEFGPHPVIGALVKFGSRCVNVALIGTVIGGMGFKGWL
jgi:hypothetical protein